MSKNPRPESVSEPCGLTWSQLRNLTDESLITHVVAGNRDGLEVLYERYHCLVGHIASRIVGRSEADDVVQNVFLEIYKVAYRFDASKGSAKVWILQYAYNRSINRRRYLKLRECSGGSSAQVERRVSAPGFPAPPAQESSQMVREALLQLTAAQRKTLELAYFQGLTVNEIAGQTGEAVGNVRHHYYRGLAKLRSLLQVDRRRSKRVQLSYEEAANV